MWKQLCETIYQLHGNHHQWGDEHEDGDDGAGASWDNQFSNNDNKDRDEIGDMLPLFKVVQAG